jgi:hypothetical protein
MLQMTATGRQQPDWLSGHECDTDTLPSPLPQSLLSVSSIVSSTAMAAATDPIFLLALLTLAILIPGFDILAILAAIIMSTSALVGRASCRLPCSCQPQ